MPTKKGHQTVEEQIKHFDLGINLKEPKEIKFLQVSTIDTIQKNKE